MEILVVHEKICCMFTIGQIIAGLHLRLCPTGHFVLMRVAEIVGMLVRLLGAYALRVRANGSAIVRDEMLQ